MSSPRVHLVHVQTADLFLFPCGRRYFYDLDVSPAKFFDLSKLPMCDEVMMPGFGLPMLTIRLPEGEPKSLTEKVLEVVHYYNYTNVGDSGKAGLLRTMIASIVSLSSFIFQFRRNRFFFLISISVCKAFYPSI